MHPPYLVPRRDERRIYDGAYFRRLGMGPRNVRYFPRILSVKPLDLSQDHSSSERTLLEFKEEAKFRTGEVLKQAVKHVKQAFQVLKIHRGPAEGTPPGSPANPQMLGKTLSSHEMAIKVVTASQVCSIFRDQCFIPC